MRIVVTGGSGRIGRYVVRELVESGHEVTSVDLLPDANSLCPSLRVDVTKVDEVYSKFGALKTFQQTHSVYLACYRLVIETDPSEHLYLETVHKFLLLNCSHVWGSYRDTYA